MAIPSIPSNFYVVQGNREVYLSWDITVGSLSYDVQRSLDGVAYASVSTVVINNYLDSGVTAGTLYYYKIAATNVDGTSPYTTPLQIIPTPSGETSLGALRASAQQKADLVNSNFITTPEWNSYINQSANELYDLLITAYEDYYIAQPAIFNVVPNVSRYPLPNGLIPFVDEQGNSFPAASFYKLRGVDMAVSPINNSWISLNKFMFVDRNKYIYPNSASSIYGMFNPAYRIMGNYLEFIPTPTPGQQVRIWYIPRIRQMLQDNDLTDISISGWSEYIAVDAAIKAMGKQELDTTLLERQKIMLIKRIEESAQNRDSNQPDTISDVRNSWGNGSYGGFGPIGGF